MSAKAPATAGKDSWQAQLAGTGSAMISHSFNAER
jgi:hypothetical protein